MVMIRHWSARLMMISMKMMVVVHLVLLVVMRLWRLIQWRGVMTIQTTSKTRHAVNSMHIITICEIPIWHQMVIIMNTNPIIVR